MASSAFFLTASSRLTPYMPAILAQNQMMAPHLRAMMSLSQRSGVLISSDSSLPFVMISIELMISSMPGRPVSSSRWHPLEASLTNSCSVIVQSSKNKRIAIVSDGEFRLSLVDAPPRSGMYVKPAAMVVDLVDVCDVLGRVVGVRTNQATYSL